jgi:predicted amidohydrolase YtcJ
MKRPIWKLSICIFLLIVLFSECDTKPDSADLILKNGVLFTVWEENPIVEAVAIKGERIIFTGSNMESIQYLGDSTLVIDLNGKFGCPGFNDAHLHFLSGGLNMMRVNLVGATSTREIQRRVHEKVRDLPQGVWLIGRGWDQSLFPDKRWPTRRILDRIAPNVPILLKRICGHAALANSMALRIAGIDANTPNPPSGEIEKDPRTGRPTGILKEKAIDLVEQYIPESSIEEKKFAIELALQEAAHFGVTSIQDNTSEELPKTLEALQIYEMLYDEGKLTCRISEWPPLLEDLSPYKQLRQKYHGNIIRFGLLKEFIDGGLGSRTAVFFEPYLDDPSSRGIPQMTTEALNSLILRADKAGFQVGIHAIGNAGNHAVLDAYDYAQTVNGIRDSRHRIEHAQVLTQEDLARFKELGVIASMQPFHCIDDMRWAEIRIGAERCQYAYAWRSLKNHGVVLAFGTDWPVVPLNPLLGLYAAVTRRDTTGYPPGGWFPEQRLTIREAIEAYTLGSAFAEFMEKEKGSLEPGKLADIVIFDNNLLEIDPADLLKTKVVYTFLGGKIVYEYTP